MKNNKIIILIVTAVVLVAIVVTGIIIAGINKGESTNVGVTDEKGVTNLDGTPIEVEPYYGEDGKPVVNDDGYQVYQVKNTYDENGEPVLVTKGVSTSENEFVYIVQIKSEDGIKNKTEEGNVQVTTVFEGNPSKIPQATQGQQSGNQSADKTDATQSGQQSGEKTTATTAKPQSQPTTEPRDLPDTIDLGGVFGTVTKDESKGTNIYKGHFVESELTDLKEAVVNSDINATFTKGVYVPEKIGDYTVVQIAYVRLYTYYDEAFEEYDWYSERGIFKPGNDKDPIVYLGKNDTFDPGDDAASIHSLFLIELA